MVYIQKVVNLLKEEQWLCYAMGRFIMRFIINLLWVNKPRLVSEPQCFQMKGDTTFHVPGGEEGKSFMCVLRHVSSTEPETSFSLFASALCAGCSSNTMFNKICFWQCNSCWQFLLCDRPHCATVGELLPLGLPVGRLVCLPASLLWWLTRRNLQHACHLLLSLALSTPTSQR